MSQTMGVDLGLPMFSWVPTRVYTPRIHVYVFRIFAFAFVY